MPAPGREVVGADHGLTTSDVPPTSDVVRPGERRHLSGLLIGGEAGKTVIITLTNDTWVASGATFDAQRQNIINGLDSAQSETLGWNNEVRDKEVVTAVVRTSDTVVTITLSAAAAYNITSDETITVTAPATALTGASELTATPTIGVSFVAAPSVGGRSRKRPRYVVEVDGELIQVASVEEAELILLQVRELAQESAARDVTTPVTPKPPRVAVKTLSGKRSTSKALNTAVARTQKTVNAAYLKASQDIARDREISALLVKRIELDEQDDEEAIIALLM